jgi:hypothetical protein
MLIQAEDPPEGWQILDSVEGKRFWGLKTKRKGGFLVIVTLLAIRFIYTCTYITHANSPAIVLFLKPSFENTHRVGENICQLYIRQRTDNQNIQGT